MHRRYFYASPRRQLRGATFHRGGSLSATGITGEEAAGILTRTIESRVAAEFTVCTSEDDEISTFIILENISTLVEN